MNYILGRLRRAVMPMWQDAWAGVVSRAAEVPAVQLGCGRTRLPNAVNVDMNPAVSPDAVWDLNKFPYPFKDNSFEITVALSILEHLTDFSGVMSEIHRISRNGASVHVLVPHFSSAAAFVDPTHRSYFSARSCDYFIAGSEIEKTYGFYAKYRYEITRRYVDLQGWLNYLVPLRWVVNKWPAFWEEYLCYVIRGGGVYWELKVIKPQ